jgi:phosphoglycerate dehydrogenase-like enzyme
MWTDRRLPRFQLAKLTVMVVGVGSIGGAAATALANPFRWNVLDDADLIRCLLNATAHRTNP